MRIPPYDHADRLLRSAVTLLGTLLFAITPLFSQSFDTTEAEQQRRIEGGMLLLEEAYREIVERFARPVDPIELAEAGVRGMTGNLDRYSAYLPPADPENGAEQSPPLLLAGLLDGDVLYLHLDRFERTTGVRVRSELLRLGRYERSIEEVAGLVIDLRKNGGGSLEGTIETADLFLEPGVTIVETDGRTDDERSYRRSRSPEILPGVPIIILVDDSTASSAEVFAAALAQNGRATLYGVETHGKGLVQLIRPLPHGSALRLTTSWYRTPDGGAPEGSGEGRSVLPDSVRRVGGLQPDTVIPFAETERIRRRLAAYGTFDRVAAIVRPLLPENSTEPIPQPALDTLRRHLLIDLPATDPLRDELLDVAERYRQDRRQVALLDLLADLQRRDSTLVEESLPIFARYLADLIDEEGHTPEERLLIRLARDPVVERARRHLVENGERGGQ